MGNTFSRRRRFTPNCRSVNIVYRLKLQSENTLTFSQIPVQPMNFSADMGCLGPDLNRHRLEVIVFAAFRGGRPDSRWRYRSNLLRQIKVGRKVSKNRFKSQIPGHLVNFSANMDCSRPDLNTDHPKVIKCAAIGGGGVRPD